MNYKVHFLSLLHNLSVNSIKGGKMMACTKENVCFDICLTITITPGSEAEVAVDCADACGTSPTIEVKADGSVVITLPLTACFSITLNDDFSVNSELTGLFFRVY